MLNAVTLSTLSDALIQNLANIDTGYGSVIILLKMYDIPTYESVPQGYGCDEQ